MELKRFSRAPTGGPPSPDSPSPWLHSGRWRRLAGSLLAASIGILPDSRGQELPLDAVLDVPPDEAADLVDTIQSLSIEELLNPEISLAAKRPESLLDSAAAAFVINNEDIRRSGARNIAEALRLAPGISVGQIDSNKWAISSRGFSDRSADKLLVMIDGRTVFSPMFSGVFWDAQHYLLEDIDRIEVIRGPGGTLWGANAVNGVINIVTKDAARTQGGYITGGAGSAEEMFAGGRYGGRMGEHGHFRTYLDAFSRDGTPIDSDDWDTIQGGFRMDWALEDSRITLSGDAYRGRREQSLVVGGLTPVPGSSPPTYLRPLQENFDIYGANLLFNYQRDLGEESDLQFKFFYDYTERREFNFDGRTNIFDAEFQHRFGIGERNDIIWGLGYRFMPDDIDSPNPELIVWDPGDTNHQLFSAFLQDEITIIEERLRFILGAKVEHNDYTAWEVQPNARLTFKPTPNQTIWGAVSRAVGVPLRNFEAVTHSLVAGEPTPVPIDSNGDGIPDTSLPLFAVGRGIDPDTREIIDPTELIGYELGYRVHPTKTLTIDLAAFYNEYDKIVGPDFRGPDFVGSPTPHLELYPTASNAFDATSYGGEIAVQWAATDWWRMTAYYAYLNLDFPDNAGFFNAGKDPESQTSLRSSWDLPFDLEFDLWWRYVDSLSSFDIEAYNDVDLRLAWRPNESFEIAIVGQNLVDPSRFEFSGVGGVPNSIPPTEFERSFYVQASFRF